MKFVHLVVDDTPGDRADVVRAFTDPDVAVATAKELWNKSPDRSFLAISVELEECGGKFLDKPAGY